MDKFLDTQSTKTESRKNRRYEQTKNEWGDWIKGVLAREKPGPDGFIAEFH
jgi:hypothetical protein